MLIALLLLLIAASRAMRLNVNFNEVTVDEVWSVWQTLGSPNDIIRWTPYDWTPLYYLGLGAWRGLVGIHPVVLRWLSLLCFVIGAAAMIRVAQRLKASPLITMLAFAVPNYLIFMSVELRGYVFLLALYPLAIWFALRYLAVPHWRRMLPLVLAMTAMIYTSLTSMMALPMMGLFTLFLYPRRLWRWFMPVIATIILCIPEILNKAELIVNRTRATFTIDLPPVIEALAAIYRTWASDLVVGWIILLGIALFFIRRDTRKALIAGLLMWGTFPIILYVTNGQIGFFNQRYAWWVMVGLALLIGVGSAHSPRWLRQMVVAALTLCLFIPLSIEPYQILTTRLGWAFQWLETRVQPGDVILLDPQCNCGDLEIFDYYSQVYLAQRAQFVQAPRVYRRVWYITGAAGATPDVLAQVQQGRRADVFFGPPEGLFRLYEAPPNAEGILFANGMRFHGIDVLSSTVLPLYHEGDTVRFRLWWSVDQQVPLDYSVSILLSNPTGTPIVQQDSAPQIMSALDLPHETSQWIINQFYIEERTLQLPDTLGRAVYPLVMAVYWYGDQVRLNAPGISAEGFLHLADITVLSW